MSILVLHKKNPSRRRHLARARRYAEEHGQRLLLVMRDPTWEAAFADRVWVADTGSVEATLTAARRLAASEAEPVRAVVTFAEACVPSVAAVAAELGLPAVSERTACLARDKLAMRQALAGHVPQPRFALARTTDEAVRDAARTGYPVVLKPVIGTGSMYVRSVDDAAELAAHFETMRRGSWDAFEADPLHRATLRRYRGALLVEEFVGGPEICVDSLVVEGTTHVIAIHDKPLPTGPTFEEVYACTPTRLLPGVVARITAAVEAVHRGLGIDMGPTHVEFRLRGGEEPVLLEAAARMGGGPIYRSVLLSTGVDLVEAALDLAMGRRPRIEPDEPPRPIGFWNVFARQPGTLTSIHGVDEVAADPRVDEVEIYRSIGEHLAVPPQTFQGHGHLIFRASSEERLDEVFRELTRVIDLRTESTAAVAGC